MYRNWFIYDLEFAREPGAGPQGKPPQAASAVCDRRFRLRRNALRAALPLGKFSYYRGNTAT